MANWDVMIHMQSSQPAPQVQPGPEYEIVMDCTTAIVDLEMTENVAYAPVHTLKKSINMH